MRKKFKYAFARKKQAEGGVVSLIYAGASLFLFLASILISFILKGNAGSWIGALGVMAFLFSACGFALGLKSFQEEERNYHCSAIGSLCNGIFLVGWLALFLNGIG